MDLDKVKYWTELSDYDLDTADAMFRTGRWLYVGYMCHQVLEKIFKAYWSSRKEEPAPYSHNLINLAQSCGLGQLLDDGRKHLSAKLLWSLTWNVNTLIEPVLIGQRHPSPLY